MLYSEITECRICKNKNLHQVLDLGIQAMTWIFPGQWEKDETWPLVLVKCQWDGNCWLLQLKHNYDLEKMYWDEYWYRSWLNAWMVAHLDEVVQSAKKMIDLKPWDLVIDIASNDGTLLGKYWDYWLELLWIDPTASKFSHYYPKFTNFISDFFSADIVKNRTSKKAKLITSISMFYDLPDPLQFVYDVKEILDDDWIRILEQSYMPTMINMVSYDTICHEHLEYYALKQIKWMTDNAWMKIINVNFNDVNWWSFQVFVTKNLNKNEDKEIIEDILNSENLWWFTSGEVFDKFISNIEVHKNAVIKFFSDIQSDNKRIIWYGASTKWNVTLQYCGITKEMLPYIAEVNEYKFWRETPGTRIPIISESEAHAMKPDYFFVLPWHFKEWILKRERKFLDNGWRFVFPLPTLEII